VFSSNTPTNGLNVSAEIMTDVLVEGTEVVNFTFSEAVIHNLNNENAAGVGAYGSSIIVINDDDGWSTLKLLTYCCQLFYPQCRADCWI
jgi:hypothetical protein